MSSNPKFALFAHHFLYGSVYGSEMKSQVLNSLCCWLQLLRKHYDELLENLEPVECCYIICNVMIFFLTQFWWERNLSLYMKPKANNYLYFRIIYPIGKCMKYLQYWTVAPVTLLWKYIKMKWDFIYREFILNDHTTRGNLKQTAMDITCSWNNCIILPFYTEYDQY